MIFVQFTSHFTAFDTKRRSHLIYCTSLTNQERPRFYTTIFVDSENGSGQQQLERRRSIDTIVDVAFVHDDRPRLFLDAKKIYTSWYYMRR